MRRAVAALFLALSACAGPVPVAAQVDGVQAAVAEVRSAVQAVVPLPPVVERPQDQVSPAAVAHIVRWEITSPAYYSARLRWPIWPGGASGVTWCIGYDGGHQTAPVIRRDWAEHGQVDRLATTAGITGQAAKAALPRYRDITTPYSYCERIFRDMTLPTYHRLARRTFADGWELLPADAQGTLTATVYNRGASMVGSRRDEMRALRDVCVPAGDVRCMALQFRSMCRIWRGTINEAGLCGRYTDAARLVEEAK